jgi:DNA-binding LytR/AlgR family response regulator
MWRFFICDSKRQDVSELKKAIVRYGKARNHEISVSVFENGMLLLEHMEHKNCDCSVVILETEISGMNGIETAKAIRKLGNNVPIIYHTASRKYAVESYEVEAAGYLLKPLEQKKLFACLDKSLPFFTERRLSLKIEGSYHYLPYHSILYAESRGHWVHIHMKEKTLLWGGRLTEFEEQLSDNRFLRSHQSYLVNMDQVHHVDEQFVLTNGECVPIRVRHKNKIMEKYHQYFKEHPSGL